MKNDYLKYINYQIVQGEGLFHNNSDTTILGMSFENLKAKTVLDIGTSTGALLLYAHHKKAKKLIGIDINKDALEYARINLEKYSSDFELFNVDIRDFVYEKVDIIVCNPPFFEANNMREDLNYRLAMFDDAMPLNEIFKAAKRLLKDNGCIYFIYQAERLFEVYDNLKEYGFKIMWLRFVNDINKPYASRVVMKIKKGKRTKTKILKTVEIKNGEIYF